MPNSWAAYLYQRPDPIVGAVYLSSHWNHYFIALTSLVLHIAHKPDVYFLIFVRILIMTKVSFRCQFILDPGPTIVLPCLSKSSNIFVKVIHRICQTFYIPKVVLFENIAKGITDPRVESNLPK